MKKETNKQKIVVLEKCPGCKRESMEKVIFAGFPMILCNNEQCNTVDGFWSFIPCIWFNGVFFVYDGPYIKGMWYWLFGNKEE